jgi:hypothetical protein
MNKRRLGVMFAIAIAVGAVAIVIVKTRKDEFDKIEGCGPGMD